MSELGWVPQQFDLCKTRPIGQEFGSTTAGNKLCREAEGDSYHAVAKERGFAGVGVDIFAGDAPVMNLGTSWGYVRSVKN